MRHTSCLRGKKKESMMKVLFKKLINGYTGKLDDLCIYYNKYLNRGIIRRISKVKLTQQHTDFAIISQQLRNLIISQGYKDDWRVYTDLFSRLRSNQNSSVCSWYGLFVCLMYAMAKELALDLKTITRAQIENDNMPCLSVKMAVDAGLLPRVRNFEKLDNEL